MAATVTTSFVDQPQPIQIQGSPQGIVIRLVKWASDVAYPTGGYPVTPSYVGCAAAPWGMVQIADVSSTTAVSYRYLAPTNSLMAMAATATGVLTELGAASALVNNTTPTFLVFSGSV